MTDQPISSSRENVEMPRPTAAPLVLSTGVLLIAMGLATSALFIVAGAVVVCAGLARWIEQWLPGRGHIHLPIAEPAEMPQPPTAPARRVATLEQGTPGYRLQLPVRMHPISAGIKGGLAGGLVMPLPALFYGWMSGHGIWWPVNLLTGLILPGVNTMSTPELEQFHPVLTGLAVAIHLVVSFITGLIYGVLMPTLPSIRKPLAWGALLMPILWTAVSYIALGVMNPGVREGIEWPWFVLSQFIFGIVAALVFMGFEHRNPIVAGLLGGLAGGLLMPIPALTWSIVAGHGMWYPVNLLAAMAFHHDAPLSLAQLEAFHAEWLISAIAVHAVLSLSFGLAYALVLPRLPAIPSPVAWGGLLLPLLWTAFSYSLMGVVNPALEERVDWPWFIVSQFIFGAAAAMVVVRSDQVSIPPVGTGPPQEGAGHSIRTGSSRA